ncbi:hypothetical protein B0H13DRAFT_2171086 [Mycena leptocephala]|nr:hypothetical protein B0H13DRAFT_2171086 [Mycena leptocephala]
MARPAGRSTGQFNLCWSLILIILFLVGVIWGTKIAIEETIAIERILRSKITNDTPISALYGPGAWWAWLITLGMTHGRMFVTLPKNRALAADWDYDLIAAGGYIIAASIDLIVKSRAVAQLEERASESPLLPALLCAERVVAIGTGSSIFTVLISFNGKSFPLRRAGTATIPFLFAFIASFFVLRAHEAIAHTTPVLWCRSHNGIKLRRREIPFNGIDFPATLVFDAIALGQVYVVPNYWICAGVASAVVAVIAFIVSLVKWRNLPDALPFAASGLVLFGLFATYPLLGIVAIPVTTGIRWLCVWAALWAPVYILAFFPQMGFYPLTGISLLETAQIAVLLGVALIAGFRIFRRTSEAAADSPSPSHKSTPILPTSSTEVHT